MRKTSMLFLLLSFLIDTKAQADNEIQVYASPTIQHKWTIVELHSNYTIRGIKKLADPSSAHWTNETLEITHGIAKNMELGFYTFTAFMPGGRYVYLGNQIRPRVTVPEEWKWPLGASLSMEVGFFRPDPNSKFIWQGEVRPIIDKTIDNLYLAFNPNIDFELTGDPQAGISPQLKAVYTFQQKFGFGIEYYSSIGSFSKIPALHQQEHLLGPMFDLYSHPMWELNGGVLIGLTENSNQRIVKLLIGRRFGRQEK
jgi:hypothetical protein